MMYWEDEPYQVVEVMNSVTVVIDRGPGSKSRVVHVDKLMKCPSEVVFSNDVQVIETPGETADQMSVFELMGLDHLSTRSGRASRPPDRYQA